MSILALEQVKTQCFDVSSTHSACTKNEAVHPSRRNFSVVAEVTHIPSGIWFLQISSQLLSKYNKLGVYRRG